MRMTFDFGRPEAFACMRRRSKRPSVLIAATIQVGEERLLGRVRNVSTGGMMIECGRRLRKGEPICVECNKFGTFHGHVAWSEGGRFGMAFDQPIDVTAFGLPANDTAPAAETAESAMPDAASATPDPPATRPTRLFGGKPLNRWVY